ncbi:hypothetical protein Tco_1112041 [Tanacetum coccineum]|uniref:Uncharacterized protein n=1 Tax=Tanacetum coccineum TaxID=301880 RepID=A0ABQ5INE5_9ASTR
MDEYPELSNDSYVLYDRVMNPLAAQLGRKVQRDHSTRRGRPSTSSSTFDQPSSSHHNDDDDDKNNEGTSRASTPSPHSLCIDIAKITRKRSNSDKHGHGKGKSAQELEVSSKRYGYCKYHKKTVKSGQTRTWEWKESTSL